MDRAKRNGWAIGLGGIAFVAFVAWLVPPTTPKAPDGVVRPVQTAAVRRLEPPALPASNLAEADPVAGGAPDTLGDSIRADVVAGRFGAPSDDAPEPVVRSEANSGMAADDGEDNAQAEDAAYAEGYRWAEQADVQDRRECRRLERGPARDGCRSYLEDAGERYAEGG